MQKSHFLYTFLKYEVTSMLVFSQIVPPGHHKHIKDSMNSHFLPPYPLDANSTFHSIDLILYIVFGLPFSCCK